MSERSLMKVSVAVIVTIIGYTLLLNIFKFSTSQGHPETISLLSSQKISKGIEICNCHAYENEATEHPYQSLYCKKVNNMGQSVCYPFTNPCQQNTDVCLQEASSGSSFVADTPSTDDMPSSISQIGNDRTIVSFEICDNAITKSMGADLKEKIMDRLEWGISENRYESIMVDTKRRRSFPDFKSTRSIFQHEKYWERYDFLGPIFSKCDTLRSFGTGDEEKRFCWHGDMESSDGGCVVYSVGSNNVFDFETDIVKRTKCNIQIFDCTVKQATMPPEVAARSTFHYVCLGRETKEINGRKFMNYADLVKLAGKRPTYLKMDIEGFEYEVLSTMMANGVSRMQEPTGSILPDQIALEFHYYDPSYEFLLPSTYYAISEMLFLKGGYMLADRRDNQHSKHCTEVLFARTMCPKRK